MSPAGIEKNADFFLMANLSPLFTALPFIVWISTRGYARHDIRIEISQGMKAKKGELISWLYALKSGR
jgi:hypothetical protein